ncbi:zincin-like metallopeptidase toxin domain-containing protein [Methanobrevibacter sp.]
MKNVSVFVDKILTGNKAAGFDYSSGTIFIKKKTGLIDLYHEGYHAEQYLKIGKESYIGLGSLARGNYVLNRIMGNTYLFNEAELQGAINYIERSFCFRQ